MSNTVPAQSSFFTPPTLPKGGGVISAGGGMLSAGGADGSAGWSIPLPVFAPPARTLTPEMALVYSSTAGNSEFGAGWSLPVASIRRDTRFGVPRYADDDRLTGPGGSQLLPAGGSRTARELPFGSGSRHNYRVSTWFEKNTGPAVRFERWHMLPNEFGGESIFWIQYSPDGSMSLYGYSANARLAPALTVQQTAEWRLEETVTPRGEHIVWHWRGENIKGCDETETQNHPDVVNVYLTKISWANSTAARHFLVPAGEAGPFAFQCFMLFDYGERNTPEEEIPPELGGVNWTVRSDAFSHWRYGFEVRTRRLCQEILLFHNKKMLDSAGGSDFGLVSRLRLNHVTSPAVSWLASVQQLAYEEDGTVLKMPPVEFDLSQPQALPGQDAWGPRTDLDGFCPPYWQMADLYGEGLPGLLYQDAGAWWYRAPERSAQDTADGVTWGQARRLPQIPSSGAGGRLTDLDADGNLEWLVTGPGLNGSFTLSPDGSWNGFIPFAALPAELLSDQGMLADLTGGGLQDLVMVGPRSVRIWPGRGREGWGRSETVAVDGSTRLPVGQGGRRLVAFSDIPGGGQAHLVEITASTVTCWPSLGRGHFGKPFTLEGFSVSPDTFSPDRLWLADTDGSGFTDILYLERGGIRVFMNQSGNAFRDAGLIPPPEGMIPDNTWHLQAADIQGLGTVSLLLTVPHMKPRSWLLNLNTAKPWLLREVSNNMGGRTLLEYRSSAQGWLDEKAALQAAGQPAVSHLPFPVHALSRVTQINDITGLALGSETRYFGGVWDAAEREFCGFTRLVQRDTHSRAAGTAREISPPAEVRSWFMTGLREHDALLSNTYAGISEFPAKPVRFTRWNDAESREETFSPTPEEETWLRRALRGVPVRTESYGMDGSDKENIPYSISQQRWQVRAHSTENAGKPATVASLLESLSYSCERIPQDPVISQSLLLTQDRYGNTLESVTLNYPRTLSPVDLAAEEEARAIYPATLPAGTIRESTDSQQYDCWLNLTRATVHNLDTAPVFVTGLPDAVRTDVIWYGTTHPDGNPAGRENHTIPTEGFSVEFLLQNTQAGDSTVRKIDSLLATAGSVSMTGYTKTYWRSAADGETLQEIPDRQALAAFTETAMHDRQSLDVLRPVFDQTLRDLVNEVLNDTRGQKDPAVLARVRGRLPQPVPGHALYPPLADVIRKNPAAPEVLSVLRGMVRGRIETPVLLQYIQDAPEDVIADGQKKAIDPNGGVPAQWLWYAVDAFIRDAGADARAQQAVLDALEPLLPDSLFWQAVTGAGDTLPGIQAFLDQRVQEETLEQLLARGGYHLLEVPFAPSVSEVYGGRHNHTTYHTEDDFWLPKTVRESELVRATRMTYSVRSLAVLQTTDDISHFTSVEAMDWRFLSPKKIKDINDNIAEVGLDALGRTVWHRFYGTETPVVTDEVTGERRLSETAVETGYAPFRDITFTPPATVEEALALNGSKGIVVHEAFTPVTDSWMPQALDAQGNTLIKQRCGELAWRRHARRLLRDSITPPDIMSGRTPPHVIHILTDRYDSDPEQQVRVQVTLHGDGQVLQTAALSPSGEAFVRTEDGALQTGPDGRAVTEQTDIRWAVTGKTEFDNKGQVIRVWMPFWLNDWRLVSDDSARDGIYADTHVYDAVGRESRVICAAGEEVDGVWAHYERRSQAYPWFTVQEDENDTWQEVTEDAKRKKWLH
ncbi:SpvB/TcaC N-terminal domain-containing protein [Enterobacter cloacae]|uniref:SpvB/TcaC N-terminal domain-containing protein n=1 Tax=Enterobacter cloacae TaxID=550 RepID=UPI0025415D1B|nr:SpvB/TcaC N-terminal domain-containing protein [Enterobacter cloacae]WIF62927.1 SpvB/TcaC N-terminal domain-containing protein [Enterobacter cloacae]